MKNLLVLATLLIVAPLVSGAGHLDAPEGLEVEAANQVLHLKWQAVPDEAATGYYVSVYAEGALITTDPARNWTLDVGTTEATYRGVNGRTYAVTVAAHDASGVAGPASAPVGATPRLARDPTYLAIGLVAIWAGLWGYVLILARIERGLQTRLDRLERERVRHGDRP